MTKQFQPFAALAACVVTTAMLTACTRAQAIENVPVGTEVTIMTQDGSLVRGKLKSVEPERVILTGEGPDSTTAVARTNISEVSTKALPERSAVKTYVVPSGTAMSVTLETALASDRNRTEDPVRATLAAPVRIDETTVIPAGSTLTGTVTAVKESGKIQGRAELGMRFDRVKVGSVTYDIRTEPLYYRAQSTKKKDAEKIGIGGAAGAVIGAITGGKKGAAIGTAVGAGAGTAVVLATDGDEIRLAPGHKLRVSLVDPLTLRVR